MVSVIIPTHDRAPVITRAIDSVLAQEGTELEVIVVDDGSTDATREVIASRYAGDERVVYLFREQTGVAGARNAGLARARGELIAFLDSDDVWRPGKLSLQLACLARVPEAGMIWSEMSAWTPTARWSRARRCAASSTSAPGSRSCSPTASR